MLKRRTNYHGTREYGLDDEAGSGLWSWARLQLERLLGSGGTPPPTAILFARDVESELAGLRPNGPVRRRQGAVGSPFDDRR